jgi:hypothetical protein
MPCHCKLSLPHWSQTNTSRDFAIAALITLERGGENGERLLLRQAHDFKRPLAEKHFMCALAL